MTNLKRLIDLQQSHYFRDETGKILLETDWKISKNDLRKEAIEWIMKIRKTEDKCNSYDELPFEYSCMSCSEGCGMCVKTVLINFIKHFFNITEEDLR